MSGKNGGRTESDTEVEGDGKVDHKSRQIFLWSTETYFRFSLSVYFPITPLFRDVFRNWSVHKGRPSDHRSEPVEGSCTPTKPLPPLPYLSLVEPRSHFSLV